MELIVCLSLSFASMLLLSLKENVSKFRSRLHPERLARGDRHGSRKHPEKIRRGEQNNKAKLTESQVTEIRVRYANGNTSSVKLAREFGVDKANILQIIHRKTWRHIP